MTPIRGWNPHDSEYQPWKTKEHYMRKYDVPLYQINMRSNNTFNIDLGSSPKFNWGSFLGFKLLDIGSMVGMMLLGGFGGKNNASVATSPYKFNNNLPNMDTFSYAGSHVTTPDAAALKKTTTTPTVEKKDPELDDKKIGADGLTDKERARKKELEAKDKLTDAEQKELDKLKAKVDKAKAKPAPTVDNDGKKVISAADFNNAIDDIKGGKTYLYYGHAQNTKHADYAHTISAHGDGVNEADIKNGIRRGVASKFAGQITDDKAKTDGYYTYITLTDETSHNEYTYKYVSSNNGELKYQLVTEMSDADKDGKKQGWELTGENPTVIITVEDGKINLKSSGDLRASTHA